MEREAVIRSSRQCGLEEGDGAFLLFVWHDFGEGEARGVVDADMDPMPRLLAWPLRSLVMRWQILLKRPSFLMSMWMSLRACRGFPVRSGTRARRIRGCRGDGGRACARRGCDGGGRDADLLGDLLTGLALAPQRLNTGEGTGLSLARRAFGTRGAIQKTVLTVCLEARDPFADGLDADAEIGGDFGFRLPLDEHAAHQFGSTMRVRRAFLWMSIRFSWEF